MRETFTEFIHFRCDPQLQLSKQADRWSMEASHKSAIRDDPARGIHTRIHMDFMKNMPSKQNILIFLFFSFNKFKSLVDAKQITACDSRSRAIQADETNECLFIDFLFQITDNFSFQLSAAIMFQCLVLWPYFPVSKLQQIKMQMRRVGQRLSHPVEKCAVRPPDTNRLLFILTCSMRSRWNAGPRLAPVPPFLHFSRCPCP